MFEYRVRFFPRQGVGVIGLGTIHALGCEDSLVHRSDIFKGPGYVLALIVLVAQGVGHVEHGIYLLADLLGVLCRHGISSRELLDCIQEGLHLSRDSLRGVVFIARLVTEDVLHGIEGLALLILVDEVLDGLGRLFSECCTRLALRLVSRFLRGCGCSSIGLLVGGIIQCSRDRDDGESRHGKHDGDKRRQTFTPQRVLRFSVLLSLLVHAAPPAFPRTHLRRRHYIRRFDWVKIGISTQYML